jgi:asparagine synthase (glutamine-hydrolysing)
VSGLAALLYRGGAPLDTTLAARVMAAQRFRGPDGEGTWSAGSVFLGHALHRTTIEAEREVSPANLDNRLFITADARIDAREDLCARLRDHGRHLRPDLPDPELILHAYDAWGERCVDYLLGDFSFALWDAKHRKLVCAVDPLGAKLFYYADGPGLFVASNTLECVRLHPGVSDRLDEAAIGDFLCTGYYQDRDLTIYADIAALPPGHLLIVSDAGVERRRYFTWPEPAEVRWRNPTDCIERFQELLNQAVRDRLRASRAGILLTGGVDSSLVAMTATRELQRQFPRHELRGFTCVYDRLIPDDERHYTRLVAESLDIPVDFQACDDGELFDWVGRIAAPQPFPEIMAGPQIDQMLRAARGYPTILTGYDGDALLAATVRLHWPERLRQRRLGDVARELAWYLLDRRAPPPIGVRTYLARRRETHEPARRPAWLRESFWRRAGLEARWARAARRPLSTKSRAAATASFANPAWGGLFAQLDASTIGVPIEARHPLCDLRLIRFALGLAAVPWCVDKRLLRMCLGALPEAIRRRPKTPLQADPAVTLFRERGLDRTRIHRDVEALLPFFDIAALDESLRGASASSPELWPLLRAVGFGAWLVHRYASDARALRGGRSV